MIWAGPLQKNILDNAVFWYVFYFFDSVVGLNTYSLRWHCYSAKKMVEKVFLTEIAAQTFYTPLLELLVPFYGQNPLSILAFRISVSHFVNSRGLLISLHDLPSLADPGSSFPCAYDFFQSSK